MQKDEKLDLILFGGTVLPLHRVRIAMKKVSYCPTSKNKYQPGTTSPQLSLTGFMKIGVQIIS